ncbi:MAG: sporulation integral membrane protein YtvI [Desulfitobacteriaceae bacterium]|nr:sporulation integral membrane protein YtvI [Desulfitobacteriaceae bacterium]
MKQTDESSKTKESLLKALILTGLCVSIYLLYYYILPAGGEVLKFAGPILLPFILAGVIAILIDPVIDFLCRRLSLHRGWAVISVIVVLIGALSTLVFLISSRLLFELQKLSGNIPDFSKKVEEMIHDVENLYLIFDLPDEVLHQIQLVIGQIGTAITHAVSVMINVTINFITSLPSIFIFFLIMMIATFFFSRDKALMQQVLVNIFPERLQKRVKSIYMDLALALVGYVRAQVIMVSINTTIAITGLHLLGANYALIMGLISGFFDILPVFGPGTVFVPWAIWNFATGNIKMGISLAALYVIMIVVRQIMEPKLVAQNLGFHPLATLAALFIGLQALGVVGIFIGPTLLVLGRAIYRAWKMT